MSLKFLHLHLHGLIRSHSLELGKDSDTGGQTQYVLELVKSLANISDVKQVDLVTRLINDDKIDNSYSKEKEFIVEPWTRGDWFYNQYLIDENGVLINFFNSNVSPTSDKILKYL